MFLAGLVSFAIGMVLMPVAIKFAARAGLVDVPNARKQHQMPTPLVGGIVIYLSLCATNILFSQISWYFLGWMGFVLVVGVLDDLFDISYRIRISAHAIVVFGIFLTDGLLVTNIGSIFWGLPAVDFFGLVAILFTALGVIGGINSVNMVDGVDGLLASLTLASLAVLVLFGVKSTYSDTAVSIGNIAMLIGAVGAFTVVNCRFFGLRRAMVFMGDAGSTVLGFFLVYALIEFSQAPTNAISPVLAGWILGMPLIDASAVIANRVLDGKAPFHPDRKHLHHLLMDAGYSVNKTVVIILCAHVTMMVFASSVYLMFGGIADPYLFWGFVALVLVRVAYGSSFGKVEIEKQELDGVSQELPLEGAKQGTVAVGLGISESIEKSHRQVGVEDVERTSDPVN